MASLYSCSASGLCLMPLQRHLWQAAWWASRLSGTAAMSLLCNLQQCTRTSIGADPAETCEADRLMGLMPVQDSRSALTVQPAAVHPKPVRHLWPCSDI